MSESLLGRVARLVGGTFTSAVDAAENAAPEVVARQAIEEVERAIDEVRAEIGRKQANRHNANRELSSLNDRAESLKQQIQTALQKDREDLAEAGANELVGIEDRLPIIESLVATTQQEEQELNRYLSGLRSKRDEMERDLQIIRDRKRADSGQLGAEGEGLAAGSSIESRVEKAGGAVARVKASVTGLPGEAETANASARAELEELHRKNRVAERLAALKKEG
ncbi:PspA/IM30 family protein [Halopseudomonas salegens]|uniref:Phage shock protein A (PspA) family protein n=1 Tax=Halopseudomonas salegens TaxID=1434072 RepID=A0A1H2GNX4_9GAMM|nr:PspA/IM30 family protein [Halopseudomonas salegens]SDU21182.1 phage shock protein A (PspA) family protein [Halopseudomonas salegens]